MLLQFVINLVLARLLTPADFGAVGMLAIFLAVSNVLIDGGFASALIQKKDATQTDWSTVFFWNIGIACLLYMAIFFCAPVVAGYFRMPVLCGVLRGIGLTLILGAMISVQLTRLRKHFAFRVIAVANILSYVVAGAMAAIMAYAGFGVWSLVAMQVLQMLIVLLVFSILTRWRPSLCFSMTTVRRLFSFGGYLLGANILQEIAKNLQGFIIGRRFSASVMGYYSQAYKLDRITSYSLPQVIVQVMFPLYAQLQDDLPALRAMLLRNVRIISFLIFPLIGVLIYGASEIIVFLYGSKWLPVVPYFRILCVAGSFACLQNINYYVVAARGHSCRLFCWSFYKWGFLLAGLLIGAEVGGMYGIMWAMVLSEINIYIVNASLAAHECGLSLWRQLAALLPVTFTVAGASFVAMLVKQSVGMPAGAALMVLIFVVVALLFRFKALDDSIVLIQKMIKK